MYHYLKDHYLKGYWFGLVYHYLKGYWFGVSLLKGILVLFIIT